jgi:hypothetical protein
MYAASNPTLSRLHFSSYSRFASVAVQRARARFILFVVLRDQTKEILFCRSQIGGPAKRVVIPKRPKLEDYFYANPTECLCQDSQSFELQAETSQLFTMIQQS